MRRILLAGIPVLSAVTICGSINRTISGYAAAQAPVQPPATTPGETSPNAARPSDAHNAVPQASGLSSTILEWTPPALNRLSALALAKESFTLDRTMLAAAAGLLPDEDADVKQAVAKLDGVSVHVLRFAAEGAADPADVGAIREAYHLRGWKHVLNSTNMGGSTHNATTDVWLVLDGANMRGAVVLVQSPKSLTLATLAGNLSPVDLLHLRGHFGIPKFEGRGLDSDADK